MTFRDWFVGTKKTNEYMSYGFAFFLQCCNHEKLSSIKFVHVIPAGALRLVGEMLPSLRCLELAMVETDWTDLSHLPLTLQSLIISFDTVEAHLTKENWAVICVMEQLQILGLTDCHFLSSEELSSVSEFKLNNLVTLNLLGTGMNDTLLTKIAATCTRLQFLQISERRSITDDGHVMLTDLGVSTIAEHKALKCLTLSECSHITNESVVSLARLSSLEVLNIDCLGCEELDASCLRSIGEMTSLKELFISEPYNIQPTDEDFASIGNLTSLKTLVLCDFPLLTDVSLEVIGSLKCLEKLGITNLTGLTDQGLVHLVHLPCLRELVCNYRDADELTMQITFAGLTMYGLSNFLVDEIV